MWNITHVKCNVLFWLPLINLITYKFDVTCIKYIKAEIVS